MSGQADSRNSIATFATWVDAIQETALSAARQAGEIQLRHFRQGKGIHHRLPHDLKLDTDRFCEQEILGVIRQRFPDHGILTEESGWLPGSGDAIWIVDPLDGTVNFWHGIPMFCVSVACYHAPSQRPTGTEHPRPIDGLGKPIVGVVLLPRTHELFIGTPGKGAFLNGRRIQTAAVEHTSQAMVTVSFGKTPAMMDRMTDRLRALLPMVGKVRCLGAVAAELAYVAAGFLGGLVYEGIKLWDFAAGKIILEEAGGFLEAVETEPDQWRVLADAPGVRQVLRAIL